MLTIDFIDAMTDKLYFDDLHVGDRFESGSHALDAAQIIAFARQFDPQPFHTDPDAAQASLFQGLAASGWHTAAITMRLLTEAVPLADGLIGAGVDGLEWPAPTRPDDVLTASVEVIDVMPSRSRPGRGRVTVRIETRNQTGAVRQRQVCTLVVSGRPV
jgi:acyl dehydratase